MLSTHPKFKQTQLKFKGQLPNLVYSNILLENNYNIAFNLGIFVKSFLFFTVCLMFFEFAVENVVSGSNNSSNNNVDNNDTNISALTKGTDFETNYSSTDVRTPSIKNIMYTAKFVCGTITSENGPIRPGHYDTDISILNKQNYDIKLLWNVIVSDASSSNSIIKVLAPESATNISCKDFLSVSTVNSEFVEGFILILIPVSGNILGAFPDPNNADVSILRDIKLNEANLIDVQVFYTANALPQLPTEVIVDSVKFQILSDLSNKIPPSYLHSNLTISVLSDSNQIYNQETRIKDIVAQKYNLTSAESEKLKVLIKKIDTELTYMIDDHALSSLRLNPQVEFN